MLEKKYEPAKAETKIYTRWLEKGYFRAEVNEEKPHFSIMMPPPNITSHLHIGHALDNTLADILIRYKRMNGYETLWQPGCDHAAIATEVKIIKKLKEEGIDKHHLGRDEFLKYAWEWKEKYGGTILNQLKRMGYSADWSRERFTMDEGCSKAVKEAFVRLYEKGYIYKGAKIVNWCPVCQTSISDAEVEYEEQNGNFWHINYPVVGEAGTFIEIATTRPETLLGDTAVAVNPKDERYKNIVGKMLELPLTGRIIPVIADEYVDMEFGTGCVKITPAHDPNDFEVGKRHNLEEINILNDDATINDLGGKYAGLDRYEARKQIIDDLETLGLLVKVVPHSHNVGTHDRCNTTVEPMIKPQWFVKMDEMAKPAIQAVRNGEIQFVPDNFSKTYLNWLENIHDWCISRQLWWGHRIPAYYCDDCHHMMVSRSSVCKCSKCGSEKIRQDEDTLDTWFSSALWPFSTLGWPDETPEFKYFYPTDVLCTGYDIIFFWVVRMVFSALEHTKMIPFNTVLIHGLVRDSQGRKMSKSLDNGIDPIDVIEKYGADALRMTLVTGNAPGNDMRFHWDRVESSRNFENKLWNATRFIELNSDNYLFDNSKVPNLLVADKWLLSQLNVLIREVTDNIEKYELGMALTKIYDFTWNVFCDWYIEMIKPRLTSDDKEAALWTLHYCIDVVLRLLHPFMPFITEEIYMDVQSVNESIMIADWPKEVEGFDFCEEYEKGEKIKAFISAVRAVRAEKNIPFSKKTEAYVVVNEKNDEKILTEGIQTISFMAAFSNMVFVNDLSDYEKYTSVILPFATIYLPIRELVDVTVEKDKLVKEQVRLNNEIARCKGMLSNENFLSKAPQSKVDEEKKKLADYETQLKKTIQELNKLDTL